MWKLWRHRNLKYCSTITSAFPTPQEGHLARYHHAHQITVANVAHRWIFTNTCPHTFLSLLRRQRV
ncbi:hypothetical protein BC826DRAFT_1056766, partial [Russula brevipes]